jgi:putative membrane protein
MQRASTLFTAAQRQQIAQAVSQAESQTSCEIVPVVATASGRYDRAEDLVGLWLAVLAAIGVVSWYPPLPPESGTWSVDISHYLPLIVLVLAMVVAFVVGASAASQIGWLRRLFTPQTQMRDEVALRARQVFFDQRVHHTASANGVLIYVSLFERTATVLASQAILDQLGSSFVDGLCRQLTNGFRQGRPTEALCGVIEFAGVQLAGPWPRAAGDVNELPDTLVVID